MCSHAVLCIYSVCTCCLCNDMYRMVQIVLCEYCICGFVYILYYVHEVYVMLCAYGALHMLDM